MPTLLSLSPVSPNAMDLGAPVALPVPREGGCSQGLEHNPNQWAGFRHKFCTTAWKGDHLSEVW